MSLEVRQLVLRASVRDDEEDEDEDDEESSEESSGCGGDDDECEDKEALKEEILAACRAMLREELRQMRRER